EHFAPPLLPDADNQQRERREEPKVIVAGGSMLKELEDALTLVGEMPAAHQREVLKAVMAIIEEYEDWKANGSPAPERWFLIKFARDPTMARFKFQAAVERMLEE